MINHMIIILLARDDLLISTMKIHDFSLAIFMTSSGQEMLNKSFYNQKKIEGNHSNFAALSVPVWTPFAYLL